MKVAPSSVLFATFTFAVIIPSFIVADVILKLLENTEFKNLIKSAKFIMKEREFYVLNKISCGDDVLVQGIVDLLLVTENGMIVVDYKTGNITKSVLEKYTNQINLYSNAIERAYGEKVNKRYIASLNSGELIEIKNK